MAALLIDVMAAVPARLTPGGVAAGRGRVA